MGFLVLEFFLLFLLDALAFFVLLTDDSPNKSTSTTANLSLSFVTKIRGEISRVR